MRRHLLIGWEAADWPLLQPLLNAGEMPGLSQIIQRGVSGPLSSLQPRETASLWTSLMTGKRATHHGISENHILDAERGLIPVEAKERQCATLWEMFNQVGKESIVVGWPATHGDQTPNSVIVSDRYHETTDAAGFRPWPPAIAGTYSPGIVPEDLDRLRVSPDDITETLMARFVPNWERIHLERDPKIGVLRAALAADASYHQAMIKLMEEEFWDLAAVHYPGLGEIIRVFKPFALPKQPGVTIEASQVYRQVLPAACRMLDMLLCQLLESAGPDINVMVVSCHSNSGTNLASCETAAESETWKSPPGIVAASGPSFAKGELLLRATVLDITPTILASVGAPIGQAMEGRVLREAFASTHACQRAVSR